MTPDQPTIELQLFPDEQRLAGVGDDTDDGIRHASTAWRVSILRDLVGTPSVVLTLTAPEGELVPEVHVVGITRAELWCQVADQLRERFPELTANRPSRSARRRALRGRHAG